MSRPIGAVLGVGLAALSLTAGAPAPRAPRRQRRMAPPAMPWMATYHCEIVAVDPVAPPAAAAAPAGHSRVAPRKR